VPSFGLTSPAEIARKGNQIKFIPRNGECDDTIEQCVEEEDQLSILNIMVVSSQAPLENTHR